jgi:hypothetical protein
MMPPEQSDDEAGGHPSANEKRPTYGSMLAVYAVREKPAEKPLEDDVQEALVQAVTPDEETMGLGPPIVEGEGDADATTEAGPSEVIDATDLVEDKLPPAGAAEAPEENLEGREYAMAVDNTGIREQFLAAGGAPSDAPPPAADTNTPSSLSDLRRKDILGRLKADYGLDLEDGDDKPALALLTRIEGMVYNDTWPSEEETRRTIRLLLMALDPKEFVRSQVFSVDLESLKTAFKADLEKRRHKKPGGNQPGSKKRKSPPPFPGNR